MATLDSNIILQGQPVNLLGAMQAGQGLAAQRTEFNRAREYQNMLSQNGAGILAGDTSSLNALAGYDPAAAMNIQNTRQSMEFGQRKMDMLSAEEARSVAEYKRKMSAEQAATEAAKIEDGVKMGLSARSPQEWDALMSQVSPDLVGMFDQRDMLANRFMSIADILKRNEAPQPLSAEGKVAADVRAGYLPESAATPKPDDEYGRYVMETKAAGGQPLDRIGFEQAKKGKGISYTGPDGTTISIGGAGGAPESQISYSPLEVDSVVSSIDAITNDPALNKVVGPLEGGGGNNIDDLGMVQRTYYGGDGLALIEKIGQLQNTTWLAARQMLKGGGAITDYESRKAEGAMARLSRAKSEDEFKAALKDLRDAVTEGRAKLDAARWQPAPVAATKQPAVIDGFTIEAID